MSRAVAKFLGVLAVCTGALIWAPLKIAIEWEARRRCPR